eukprot:CAMPEP_0206137566 /NCGR_PEP_ID=MMETSP1473-20131121/2667_1 /ASSEMBLY_ACC=CAM_ASM_001109 /TAXON_ID=1461547 /ORGANISM="Stichococcus sp, Strain RCC1054" /LENGTH=131 /DNA_ID=CAMNT_0053530713 /DNA_START=408 /DNA_END=800 /DNA_ORIENTATION=+
MTDEFPPPPDPPDSKEPSDQDMRVQQMSRQEGLHRVTRISLGTACRLGCAASQLAEPEDDLPALLEKLLAEGVVGTVEVSSAAWITARRFSATPSLRGDLHGQTGRSGPNVLKCLAGACCDQVQQIPQKIW